MILIRYSCLACGLVDVGLLVPPRESAQYDVREWMNDVGQMIADDHRTRSPKCGARSAQNVKIPANGEWIG